MNSENNNFNPNFINGNNIPSNQPVMPVYNQINSNGTSKKVINKKIILIIIAILIVAVGILTFFYFNNKSNNPEVNLSVVFDPNKPIPVKKDGKYGYIDSDGKMIIEPKYISADDFYGEYAIVKTEKPADSILSTDEIYQVIDKKGNVKASSEDYNKPNFISEYEIWVINDMLYNSKLKPITSETLVVEYANNGYFGYKNLIDNTSGIMDYKGKILFSSDMDSIYFDININKHTKEGYASITSYGENEVDAIVSLQNGKVLYSLDNPSAEYISAEGNGIFYYYNQDIENGYSNRTWLYFYNDELAYKVSGVDDLEIYDAENQILEIDYDYNYESLGKTSRYEYYDVKNKKILDEKPNLSDNYNEDVDLMQLTYGYKTFSNNGRYGLISGDKVVLPCEYEDVSFISSSLFEYMKNEHNQELVLLKRDNKTMLMDLKSQKALTTFESSYVTSANDSTFIKASIYENWITTKYVIYNVLSGKSMTVNIDDTYVVNSNYITITKNNKKTYYNTNLEQIYVEDLGN